MNKNVSATIGVIGGAIGIAVLLVVFGGKAQNQPLRGGHAAGLGSPSQQNQVITDTVGLEDTDYVLGDSGAPVTLVEFGDYQCTFCTRFFKETESALIERYVKTGKLKIIFRDLAINGRESNNAAEAAECAGEQGKYWEYHDRLFNERRGYNVGVFKEDNLKRFATDLGLNQEQFAQCYESSKYRSEVSKDTQDARRFGATGTPTFFINGLRLVGAQPIEVFAGTIDQFLTQQ